MLIFIAIFAKMIFQLIAPFSDLISWVVEHMGSGEFLPSNWLMDLIADFVCGETLVTMMMMMVVTDCRSFEDVMRDADDDLTMLSYVQDQTTRLRLFAKM